MQGPLQNRRFSDPTLYKVVADAYAFPEEVVGPQIPYIRSRYAKGFYAAARRCTACPKHMKVCSHKGQRSLPAQALFQNGFAEKEVFLGAGSLFLRKDPFRINTLFSTRYFSWRKLRYSFLLPPVPR